MAATKTSLAWKSFRHSNLVTTSTPVQVRTGRISPPSSILFCGDVPNIKGCVNLFLCSNPARPCPSMLFHASCAWQAARNGGADDSDDAEEAGFFGDDYKGSQVETPQSIGTSPHVVISCPLSSTVMTAEIINYSEPQITINVGVVCREARTTGKAQHCACFKYKTL